VNSGIFNKFSQISENEKVAFRKKALIFAFFLVISIIFWFINKLSYEYTQEISYPIIYKNFPSQKVQVGNPPENLNLKVIANGYTLLWYKLSSKYIPISLSVDQFTFHRLSGKDTSSFFLQTIYARDYIARQLSSKFEILAIAPDTLFFRFANMKSGIIPVKPQFTYQLEKQMILKADPVINPDSILVSGPDYIIDTLSGLETLDIDLGIIARSKVISVNMKETKNIYFRQNKVKVSFDIEKFTEKTIQIPIVVSNLPDNLKLQTFPPNIQLVCQVGLSNYEKLQSNFFKVQVDYKEIAKAESDKLKVELVKQPDFIRIVNFTPKTVEYLIEK
jgi:hypothetical protein